MTHRLEVRLLDEVDTFPKIHFIPMRRFSIHTYKPFSSGAWLAGLLGMVALVFAGGCDGVAGLSGDDDPSFSTDVAHETLSADAPETEEIDQGQYGNIEGGLQRVVRSEAEYADVWTQLHGHKESTPDRPSLDFEEESLLVIVMEAQPTGGYDMSIDQTLLSDTGEEAQVQYTERSPGENCSVTQVQTSPYVLATIDAPVDDARFEVSSDVRSCDTSE